MSLRNRRFVIITLACIAIVGFLAGGIAAHLSRNNSICPNGKPPVAQRSEVIGQTQYRCSDGVVVTK